MKIVGLTGGIGSGKTHVSTIFQHLGIPVYYADLDAKKAYVEDADLKKSMIDFFGAEVYQEGALNTKHLASMVFADSALLKELNALVHPVVAGRFKDWIAQQNSIYVLKEAAILFESGANKGLDGVIGVHAPESLRIQRVVKRDSTTEEVRARMSKQMPQEELKERCDYLISNAEHDMLLPQVLRIHEDLIS